MTREENDNVVAEIRRGKAYRISEGICGREKRERGRGKRETESTYSVKLKNLNGI